MKIILLTFALVLTGLDLQAQMPPPQGAPGIQRRLPRYGYTNGLPSRFQPGARPQAGGAQPGGLPGAPGGAGIPGGPGGTPGAVDQASLSSSYSASSAFAAKPEEMIAPGLIDFEGVELGQVLDIYAKLVNRTLLRASLPQAQIVLKTQTPLTKTEAIEALQAVLAMNGVSLINVGDKFVKVMPSDQAGTAAGEFDDNSSTNLPDLGSYITHVVQLKYIKPSEMVPVIQPFAKLNSIIPLDGNGILVIRDYAENVKRMLEMIDKVDIDVPTEYISEVIPIRYQKVDDIASALNALGGGGGSATVSVGGGGSSSTISGLAGNRGGGFGGGSMGGNGIGGGGGLGSQGGYGGGNSAFSQNRGLGGQSTPNGTPSGGAQSFQDRLRNIIANTSGGGGGGVNGSKDQIQLFGQTKIIPNESSSSLLIYATRADMEVIKGIIAKLDIPLPQVLVEAAIIDFSLGPNDFKFGVSVAQNPAANGNVIGGGGVNNSGGSPFIQFMKNVTTNYGSIFNGSNMVQTVLGTSTSISSSSGSNSVFGNNLAGGLSYFGNIGPTWDVALNAAQSDSHASVIQRPRIQTSQAKPAQFFVGDTVPYVTGNSYGTAYGSGVSYSQLSVGVELDVIPFINPDGLVVMDIQQEIDDLNGFTTIQNVGQVPNTIKRTLNAEIAVRDQDTVMLGGFIKANKSTSRAGVPFLMDIPILGNLFLQRSDSKAREELVVLMRPTVLGTPELAARNTYKEEQRLPGVARSESENAEEERKLVEAERKREMQKYKANHANQGFFTPPPEETGTGTNSVRLDTPPPRLRSTPAPPPESDEASPATPIPATPMGTMAPNAGPSAPINSTERQQRAAAALAEKMYELNSGPTNVAH